MHVVVDARLARAAGHRTYIRNIVPTMAAQRPDWQWTLIGHAGLQASESWWRFPNCDVVETGARMYGVREQLELPRCVPRAADVYWATHYNVPLAVRTPMVVTIHDLAHLRLPEYVGRPLRRVYATAMHSLIRRRVRQVMCDSRFTLRELQSLVGSFGDRASVVHLGADHVAGAGADAPAAPYVLFVGNIKPHKNLATVVRAMARLPASVHERLVVVGMTEGFLTRDDSWRSLLGHAGVSERVSFAGTASDTELYRLMQGATALIMPSLYEGFGLPPLEAMALGCPAIVSRADALVEMCGDAAIYVDAYGDDQIADAIARLASDTALRRSMVERGRERAARFTWRDAAAQAVAILERAANGR